MQGARFRPLVRELRSYMPNSVAKKLIEFLKNLHYKYINIRDSKMWLFKSLKYVIKKNHLVKLVITFISIFLRIFFTIITPQ